MARTTLSLAIHPASLRLRRASRALGLALLLALATGCGLIPGEATPAPSAAKSPDSLRVPQEEDAAPPPVITVGKAAKDAKLAFKVTKFTKGVKRIGPARLGVRPSGQYVFVFVTVANRSDGPQTFFGDNQVLVSGAEGAESTHSADTRAASYLRDSKGLYKEIDPGKTARGVIVFDIPKTTKPTAIELHDSAYSRGVRVRLR